MATRQTLTHAERVIDAASGVTKGELADYFERVAPLLLPHLKARPVALVRAPDGVGGDGRHKRGIDPPGQAQHHPGKARLAHVFAQAQHHRHVILFPFVGLGGHFARFGPPAEARLDWRPTTTVSLDEERAQGVLKLVDALEDSDDVQNVYANFDLPEAVLARLSA